MGKKPAKTALKQKHDTSVKSDKTWIAKSPLTGYIVRDADGTDHSFFYMNDAIDFYWS